MNEKFPKSKTLEFSDESQFISLDINDIRALLQSDIKLINELNGPYELSLVEIETLESNKSFLLTYQGITLRQFCEARGKLSLKLIISIIWKISNGEFFCFIKKFVLKK